MAPIGKKTCVYVKNICTWTTATHHPIPTRKDIKSYIKAHSSECLHNQLVLQTRQRTREQEEAEMLRRIEVYQRQENSADTKRQARANKREDDCQFVGARLLALENRKADGNNPRREVATLTTHGPWASPDTKARTMPPNNPTGVEALLGQMG